MPAETILVVDDERGILLALKGILEDEGYRPILVEDGESALRRLREQPVDLVLLDIWLPGRDGVAILQEITQGWPAVPVVMMSGHGTIETAVRTTKLGAYDFIEKPSRSRRPCWFCVTRSRSGACRAKTAICCARPSVGRDRRRRPGDRRAATQD